ncbi:MAG: hypothetical protein ABIE74_05435, partial [Pseudomonadota bacterium]
LSAETMWKQQPVKFLYHREIKNDELSITITDPAIQDKYIIAAYKGPDGNTISTNALRIQDKVGVIITSTGPTEIPTIGGENLAGGSGAGSSSSSGGGLAEIGGGLEGAAAQAGPKCSLEKGVRINSQNAQLQLIWLLVSISALFYLRKVFVFFQKNRIVSRKDF